MMSGEIGQRKRLNATIVLLSILTNLPALPRRCELPNEYESRSLGITDERRLAKDFAFISAVIKDPNRVTAVALEEDDDGGGLTLRLAANTGDLEAVKAGFRHVGEVLEDVSLRTREFQLRTQACESLNDLDALRVNHEDHLKVLEGSLFRLIIMMDWQHILSRLRSVHATPARRGARQTLVQLMSDTIETAYRNTSTNYSQKQLLDIQERVTEIRTAFETFETSSNPSPYQDVHMQKLMALCKGFSKLEPQLQFTRTEWKSQYHDPSTVRYLEDEIGKLAQYYNASVRLTSAAAKRPRLFARFKVQYRAPVAIDRTYLTDNVTGFNDVCNESIYKGLTRSRKALLREAFQRRLSEQTSKFKVHAEIQLLFFYEQNPEIRRPRIICSSKHGCYLCHLFMLCHGKFVIPRTHGRLYPQWALPVVPPEIADKMQLRKTIRDMELNLRSNIHKCLSSTESVKRYPNESILSLMSPASSAQSLRQTYDHVKARIIANAASILPSQVEEAQPHTPSSSILMDVSSKMPSHERSDLRPLRSCSWQKLPRTINSRKNKSLLAETFELQQHSWTWSQVSPSQSRLLSGPGIDLFLSMEPLREDLEQNNRTCWVGTMKFSSEELTVYHDIAGNALDVEVLASYFDMTFESGAALTAKPLLLKAGGVLFVIKYAFGDGIREPPPYDEIFRAIQPSQSKERADE